MVTLRLLYTGHESGWYSAQLFPSSYEITEFFSPYTVNAIELRLSEYQVLPLVQLFVTQFIQLIQLVLGEPRNSAWRDPEHRQRERWWSDKFQQVGMTADAFRGYFSKTD